LGRETARLAVNWPAELILAFGKPGRVGRDVGHGDEVEIAVAVEVAEPGCGRPALRVNAGPGGDVLERPVTSVPVEHRRAQAGDEQVVVPVAVVVGHRAPHAVAPAANAGPGRDILEGAVTPVAKERIGRWWRRRLDRQPATTDKVDIEPA